MYIFTYRGAFCCHHCYILAVACKKQNIKPQIIDIKYISVDSLLWVAELQKSVWHPQILDSISFTLRVAQLAPVSS